MDKRLKELFIKGESRPKYSLEIRRIACWKKINALISNIDFTPTILDIAGVDYDPMFDGQSFKPQLRKNQKENFILNLDTQERPNR